MEHEHPELQRAQVADGAATQRTCANPRKQKEERRKQEQVTKTETRGRKRNEVLKNFNLYMAEVNKPREQDQDARTKANNVKSTFKCRLMDSVKLSIGIEELSKEQKKQMTTAIKQGYDALCMFADKLKK